jgi:aquaporin Z
MEAAELGLFMVSALFFATLLEHPDSPLRGSIPNDTARRVLGGLAMGATAIALIYSPWGKQSGAHLNPAVTLTFWRLGRVRGRDAFFYGAAQFLGGATAVLLVGLSAGPLVADPKVQYAATVPGPAGAIPAFFGELLISFLLMTTLLRAMEHEHLAPYTGFVAGALVAIYIAIESPISGMSMNPARTFASAVGAKLWTSVWIYLTAPPIGMLLAAEIHRRFAGRRPACAKLVHARDRTCIFCGQEPLPVSVQAASELARRIGP